MESQQKVLSKDLIQMLVESNLITEEQLRHINELKAQKGAKLEQILIQERLITPQQLANFIGAQLEIPVIDLKKHGVKSYAIELVPEFIARKYCAIPIDADEDKLIVAMEDPRNIHTIDALTALTKRNIQPMVGTPQDIFEMIDRNYKTGGEIEEQLSKIPRTFLGSTAAETDIPAEIMAQAPVVRSIDILLKQAIRDRASDIHIEPQEDQLRIRYRVDGILHEFLSLPINIHPLLISRIKIMAGLNIAERRRPQDGQITFNLGDRNIDIRVATSNTIYGEMAVLRLLDKHFAFLPLSEIGFLPEILESYRKILKSPFGIILISGPTGSGKTTTLYATVNQLDATGRNIVTIEDPVEYRFKHINQMQVNPEAGVTFASGLRATMRLDPNVILVGEIRDAETARIAIQAALTGHLVLSSVHANDTVGAIFRMIDLGIEPFLLASALIGIIAQRMVRKVCPHCSSLTSISHDEQLTYEQELNEERKEFLIGAGCNFCAKTGYFGRTGIFEVMAVSEQIRRKILRSASSDDLRAQAYKDGMVSLWRDGMLKVKSGITTPYEVARNVYSIS